MSDDAPKSAYEIAMEKLKLRDRERGETAPTALTDGQKKAIADIRKVFEARLAEREILHRSERDRLLSDPEGEEKLGVLEKEYVKDRQRIEEQREQAIRAARTGSPGIPRKKSAGPKAKMMVAALGLGFLASGHHLAAPAGGRGAAQEPGRVASGYVADPIAVPGNPLDDIGVMKEVDFVMAAAVVGTDGSGSA